MFSDNSKFDINCDLGEIDPSLKLEREIMPLIGRCNIAAGGHAGTPEIMRETIFLALNHGVEIGAHPSFPDKDNFGRVAMKMSDKLLIDSIKRQISDFLDEVENCGATIDHIKAHGALYHYLNKDVNIASQYILLIEELIPEAKLLLPENSVLCDLIDGSPIELIYEAFADRRYNVDRTLQSRKISGSVITDKDEVIAQVIALVKKGGIIINDELISLKANSICVHSDSENAVQFLEAINKYFR